MSENRISRWGVGPKIAIPSLLLTLAVWAAASAWPEILVLRIPEFLRSMGSLLIAIGLAVWVTGAFTVMRAYNRDELVTTGVFALVRHPVYAGWITFVFPGLALYTGAWPFAAIALLAYGIFTRQIHREEDYLAQHFGTPYLEYRRHVNAVIPIPRFYR